MGAVSPIASTHGGLPVDVGYASRPIAGASVSGDHHTLVAFPGGVLIVVVDGLGHGEDAAVAARLAIATVEESADQPLRVLFERCNSALNRTRGAVMSAATIDTATQIMTWAAIGNVDASLFRAGTNGQRRRDAIVMVGGVIGSRLPTIRLASLKIDRGDTLVMATDGIGVDFGSRITQAQTPQALANDIMAHCGKTNDDALVVVARWRGGSHL